jgi:hypothetical protein
VFKGDVGVIAGFYHDASSSVPSYYLYRIRDKKLIGGVKENVLREQVGGEPGTLKVYQDRYPGKDLPDYKKGQKFFIKFTDAGDFSTEKYTLESGPTVTRVNGTEDQYVLCYTFEEIQNGNPVKAEIDCMKPVTPPITDQIPEQDQPGDEEPPPEDTVKVTTPPSDEEAEEGEEGEEDKSLPPIQSVVPPRVTVLTPSVPNPTQAITDEITKLEGQMRFAGRSDKKKLEAQIAHFKELL